MTKFIDLLKAYVPTKEEEHAKSAMIEFYYNNGDCFERSCEVGHFTGSALLVDNNEESFLLMHHRKLNKWLQLGGHCDGDDDVLAVSIKEAQEESGIIDIVPIKTEIFDVDIHEIPAYKNIPPHKHFDIRFLLKVNSDEKIKKNKESKQLKWFKEFDDVPAKDRPTLRLIEKFYKKG